MVNNDRGLVVLEYIIAIIVGVAAIWGVVETISMTTVTMIDNNNCKIQRDIYNCERHQSCPDECR